MKRAALALAAGVMLYAAPLRARTPEIAIDPVNGIWIAQDDKLVYQTLDRWTVTAFGATINKMVVDQTILWLATDDGVVRFETGSQRSTRLTMDDGLPSERVNTVAFDDQYVWFGTNKGLVRYRKTDRTIKVYDETNGLPNKTITYAITIGRQVWFATRAGIAGFLRRGGLGAGALRYLHRRRADGLAGRCYLAGDPADVRYHSRNAAHHRAQRLHQLVLRRPFADIHR